MYLGKKASRVNPVVDESEIDQADEPNFDNADLAIFDHRTADTDLELASEIAADKEAAQEEAELHDEGPKDTRLVVSHRHLTPPEECDLIKRWQSHRDPSARDALARAFQDKIKRFARSYFSGGGMDADDKIAHANIGFLKGLDKFDPKRRKRLWTCAKEWIRDARTGSEVAFANQTQSSATDYFRC